MNCETEIRLNLGCASRPLTGYVNIDLDTLEQIRDRYPDAEIPDGLSIYQYDIFNLPFDNDSITEVRSESMLEHLSFLEERDFFLEMQRIIKPGGVLNFSVPDFEKIVSVYTSTGSLSNIMGFLYGGQDYAENCHYSCWDFNSLAADLKECGFASVDRYDWRTVEHSQVDDYSQAYIPHMDKENGLHMCLNVEAVK